MRFNPHAFAMTVAAILTLSTAADEPQHFAADRPVDCLHIKLELEVDLPGKHVAGKADVTFVALRDISSIKLDAIDLSTTAVTLQRDGQPATPVRFANDGRHIEIMLDEPLTTGQEATVTVEYSVDNPADGLRFFGPSENEPDVPYVVWSQGESTTNSYWFPCFDNPNERQTTELIVTTDRKYKVSSNGRLLSEKTDSAAGTVTFHWLQDKPHVAYLVSMVVGEFHVESETWRGKSVEYWVHPRFAERTRRTFKNTTRMLDFFSDIVDIEYPWDRYAQICAEGFGGGMENTSATTLGTWSLHDERSAIDSDSDGLIAHELAHQWWGDLLTCRDWAHLWLNEGFASYFEALWDEFDLGDDEFRYNMYRKARGAIRGGKKRPVVDRAYESPGDMFDSRAYPKGAWVLHMLRRRLGDEVFYKALHRYGTDNAFKTVETVDLRKAVETVSGRSFERFFYDWTERAGHPEVTISYKWLNKDGLAKVSLKQTQEAAAFHFPLTLEFRFDDDTPPVSATRDIAQKQESFYFPLAHTPTMFRVDTNLAVLMELEVKKGKDLWKAQLLEDPDPIARIRAAKHFGDSKSDSDRKLLAEALGKETFWGVQREIAAALGDAGGDIARDALIEGLKFENHKARRACVDQLDSFHKDDVAIAAVRPIVQDGDVSYNVESAAIGTYARLEPDDAVDVLKEVLTRDSRNEVIRSAALSGLGRLRDPAVVPILIRWAEPDKPRRARPSAIRALASVTKRMHVDDETIRQIVDALTDNLSDTGRRVRGAAVRALGALADPGMAKSALPALESIVANDGNRRVRKSAKKTIEAIEKGEPAQLQLADLRKDLKSAMEANDDLRDRIEKLESRVGETADEPEDAKEVASTASDAGLGSNE